MTKEEEIKDFYEKRLLRYINEIDLYPILHDLFLDMAIREEFPRIVIPKKQEIQKVD